MAAVAAKDKGAAEGVVTIDSGSAPAYEPGALSKEELFKLYEAGEIKTRSLGEQVGALQGELASWKALGAMLMEKLGVDEMAKVVPAIEDLQKNRQQRRDEQKSKPRGGAGRKGGKA